jgi:hypothetical protein
MMVPHNAVKYARSARPGDVRGDRDRLDVVAHGLSSVRVLHGVWDGLRVPQDVDAFGGEDRKEDEQEDETQYPVT